MCVCVCVLLSFHVHVHEVPVIPVAKLLIPLKLPISPLTQASVRTDKHTHTDTHTRISSRAVTQVSGTLVPPRGRDLMISHRTGPLPPGGRIRRRWLAGSTYRLKRAKQRHGEGLKDGTEKRCWEGRRPNWCDWRGWTGEDEEWKERVTEEKQRRRMNQTGNRKG